MIKFVKGTKIGDMIMWRIHLVDENGNETFIGSCNKSSKGGWRGNLVGEFSKGWETDRFGMTRGEVAESLVEKYLELVEAKKAEEVKEEAPEVESEIAVDVEAPKAPEKEIYRRLMTLIQKGKCDAESFIEIAKEYATLSERFKSNQGYSLTFTSGSEKYTMYNSFYGNDKGNYIRFAEDLTMMVHRLCGSNKITYTPNLIKYIKCAK